MQIFKFINTNKIVYHFKQIKVEKNNLQMQIYIYFPNHHLSVLVFKLSPFVNEISINILAYGNID